jgi:hypothetical protein
MLCDPLCGRESAFSAIKGFLGIGAGQGTAAVNLLALANAAQHGKLQRADSETLHLSLLIG